MTAAVITPPRPRSELRRIRPATDLPALADLIETSYGPELALTGSNLVERLRQYASMAAFLGFAERIAPLLDGFVWFEDDLLVGNVSINRDANIPGGWTISNVAVLPAYRGRGIAGRLMDTALAYLDDASARCVRLQVRSDNEPAVTLYRHRGFAVYETIQEMRLARYDLGYSGAPHHPQIGPPRLGEAKEVLQLARQHQPDVLRELQPIRRSDLGLGLWQRILWLPAQALGLTIPHTLVARSSRSLVGYAHLEPMGSGTLGLKMHLTGDHAPQLAPPLVRATVGKLGNASWAQIVAEVADQETDLIAALQTLGFAPLRKLYGMIWEPPRRSRRRAVS